ARQVGKSTLALNLDIPNNVTLDDIHIYESARNDPKGIIEHCSKPIVIDEIQRVPILLLAIKEFVDKNRTNGQFILTDSANLKGFKDISDSLAGRIGIVELYRLSQKGLGNSEESLIDILCSDIGHLEIRKYDKNGLSEKVING
ncbi:AAA family ATPase, partial [Campylobacter concisus]|uniref:AAA family ATPase n=1 Tax=Campylobacter concisus TaxID=199 RepID=UPI0015E1B66B